MFLNHSTKTGARMGSNTKKAPPGANGTEKPSLRIVEKPYDTMGEEEKTPFGVRQAVTKGAKKGYYYPEHGTYYWF